MKHKIIVHLFLILIALGIVVSNTNVATSTEHDLVEALWKEFKLENGKVYTSREEEYNRLVLT